MKRRGGRLNKILERVKWSLAGTLIVFCLFEAFFRIAGVFALGWIHTKEASAKKGSYTILCEGDSFTFGVGGVDFPSQLQQLLTVRHGEGTFRTVNKGIPGMNTALLADQLESHIMEYDPDVVIVTTGENNMWNSIRMGPAGGGDHYHAGGRWRHCRHHPGLAGGFHPGGIATGDNRGDVPPVCRHDLRRSGVFLGQCIDPEPGPVQPVTEIRGAQTCPLVPVLPQLV